jgi:hypothetical protein
LKELNLFSRRAGQNPECLLVRGMGQKKKRLGPKTTHNTRPLSDETLSRTV